MAVGSVIGSFISAKLLGIFAERNLPVLAVVLLASSLKLWLIAELNQARA